MQVFFSVPNTYAVETLYAHLDALQLEGLTGWTLNERLIAEFPGREHLTPEESGSLSTHVAAYIHRPTWTELRTIIRPPLLDEADRRINMAEDNGEDTTALRTYRQALRDVTRPPSTPESYPLPLKPWE